MAGFARPTPAEAFFDGLRRRPPFKTAAGSSPQVSRFTMYVTGAYWPGQDFSQVIEYPYLA